MVIGKIRTIGKSKSDYQDSKPLERWGVKCLNCGNEFETISDAWAVKCPKCYMLTDRIKEVKE